MRVSLLQVQTAFEGRLTRAVVEPVPEGEAMGRFRIQAVRPELDRGLIGYGEARCRPEDHFDRDIGEHIAVARAMADFAGQVVQRAAAMSVTEDQYRFGRLSGLRESLRGTGGRE